MVIYCERREGMARGRDGIFYSINIMYSINGSDNRLEMARERKMKEGA